MARAFHTLTLLAAVALAAGCSVDEAPAPSPTGPSELALSLTMKLQSDTVTQDGSSQLWVDVLARDASGRAYPNVSLRFDVVRDQIVDGKLTGREEIVDFGVVSPKSASTGGDGSARVWYTAPPPPLNSPTTAPTSPSTIKVRATPTGTNFANATSRSVEIRVIPAGPIYDPGTGPVASFLFAPTAPGVGVPVIFNASASKSPVGVTSYAWAFGDGTTGSGVVAQHSYATAGTYAVRLTITDSKGQTAWTTQYVPVAAPKASFTWSPATPTIVLPAAEVIVTFDAGLSWVANPPATYAWVVVPPVGVPPTAAPPDGVTTHYHFAAPGTYNVTLTVTDSGGAASTITKPVTVIVQ